MTKIKLLATSIVAFGVFSVADGMNSQSNDKNGQFNNSCQTTVGSTNMMESTQIRFPTHPDSIEPSVEMNDMSNGQSTQSCATAKNVANWLRDKDKNLRQKAYKAVRANPENYFLYTEEESNYINRKKTCNGEIFCERLENSIDAKRSILHILKKYRKGCDAHISKEILHNVIDEQIQLLLNEVGNKKKYEIDDIRNSVPCRLIKLLLYVCPSYITGKLDEKFNISERATLGIFALDFCTVFLASKYFKTVEDFINLTYASPNLLKIMEKFHYNPVSLNKKTLKFFPNIKQLHTYNKHDKYLSDKMITGYVGWERISLAKALTKKQALRKIAKCKTVFFNNVVIDDMSLDLLNNNRTCTAPVIRVDDTAEFEKRNDMRIVALDNMLLQCFGRLDRMIVPNNITSIGWNIFESLEGCKWDRVYTGTNRNNTGEIIFRTFSWGKEILQSGIKLPEIVAKNCMDLCGWRSNTPINIADTIEGNRLFFYTMLLSEPIVPFLSSDILKYMSIIVPNGITGLRASCFYRYDILERIELPTTLIEIGDWCFSGCHALDIPKLPTSLTKIGEYVFSGYSMRKNFTTFFKEMSQLEYRRMTDKIDNHIRMPYKDFELTYEIEKSMYKEKTNQDYTKNRRNRDDLFNAIKHLKLRSFGMLEFDKAQNMSEFSKEYPDLTHDLLVDNHPSEEEDLLALAIPTTVTALNSPISYLNNVSSMSLPSTIKDFNKGIIRCCRNLQKIILPLNMQDMILRSSDSTFWDNISLTAICDADAPNMYSTTFTASSCDQTEFVNNALRKLRKLKELSLGKKK